MELPFFLASANPIRSRFDSWKACSRTSHSMRQRVPGLIFCFHLSFFDRGVIFRRVQVRISGLSVKIFVFRILIFQILTEWFSKFLFLFLFLSVNFDLPWGWKMGKDLRNPCWPGFPRFEEHLLVKFFLKY